MAFVLGRAIGGTHGPGGSLGKIEDEETGKNLLQDKFRFLCVEMDQTYGVLQAAEGGLNAPTPGVEGFEDGEGKKIQLQICDKSFRISAVSLQADNAEGYFIEI